LGGKPRGGDLGDNGKEGAERGGGKRKRWEGSGSKGGR